MKRILLQLFVFFIAFGCKKNGVPSKESKLPHYYNKKIELEIDSLTYYLDELEKIPKTGLTDSLKAEYSYIASRFNNRLGKHDNAINNLNGAVSFSKNKIKSNREATYFVALRETYFRYKNDYLSAQKVNEKLLLLLDSTNFRSKGHVFLSKAHLSLILEKNEEALKMNNLAEEMFEKAKDTLNYAKALINEVTIHSTLGNDKEALKILSNFSYENYLSDQTKFELHGTKGYYYNKIKSYDDAIQSFNNALKYAKVLANSLRKTRVINSYVNLSDSYIGIGKYDIAQKYIDSIYGMGLENVEYNDLRGALRNSLASSYYRKENLSNVLGQLDSIFKYQDKSYSERIKNELEVSKVAFEKEIALEKDKREAEMGSLIFERNQYILAVLLLMAVVIGVLVLNFYRQRKFKIEQDNFLLHQRLLRSQMNPHFTFNSLSLIKSYMEEDKEQSVKYIQKFSKLLRGVFENSTKDYVPLEDELESLQHYIELQQFRFEGRFSYSIENNIEEEEVLIPPMLLQPFVENAIIHGFRKNDVTGNLSIRLNLEDTYIDCIIEDDGVGIDEKGLSKKSSVKLIDEFLKKMTGQGIIIVNKKTLSKKEKGTKVELKIPCKLF